MQKLTKRTKSLMFPVIILFLVMILLAYFGMQSRRFRAPYPLFGKKIAWMINLPEQAYNFDVVIPGKLYRSGKPDERFIRYVHEVYGINHLISFTGNEKSHDLARRLGMDVRVYEWSTRHLPPDEELAAVIDYIQKNNKTLIHCAGGSDRTGYAVAFYRVLKQNWKPEKALKEMEKYWHDPEKKEALHSEMKDVFKIKE